MSEAGEYLNYDGFASIYDRTRVIPPDKIREVVDMCGRSARLKRSSGLFLDAGVGTGRFGAIMADAYPGRVVGVDVSTDMLAQARVKSDTLNLVRGDLRRLPFPDCTFNGVLVVHILHLIERWQSVIDELWRVIAKDGVLILGAEQGGRSILVDFYLQQARGRNISTDNLGAGGLAQPLAYLRQKSPQGAIPRVELLSGPRLAWHRNVSVLETIATLEARAFSQMRHIDETAHGELISATRNYARSTLGSLDAVENLEARFVLYAVYAGSRRNR